MSTPRRVPRVFTELFRRRTWGEFGYAFIGLFQGVFGFVFTVTTFVLSVGLMITFIGLPLMAASGQVARWLAAGVRRGSRILTGNDVAEPPTFRPNPGVLGWIGSGLRDGTAWRARLYLVLKLPLGILGFAFAITFYAAGLSELSYPIWRPFLPCNTSNDGKCHRAAAIGPSYYVDTPLRIFLFFLVGVVLLLAAPWVVRGVLQLDKLAVRGLLGPTRRNARVAELERTRATAVDDSAATLRRIERDLHDGAQARMVAVAMNVGLAREKLAEGADPADAARLLDAAHSSAKEAITELRDLARGIHPPVLDTGLASALQTLVTHSVVPVELHTLIDGRQDPAIETMAYFCVAELLTNVGKHSGASRVRVNAVTAGPWLRLQVNDDGRGGARLGAGSGLAGLADRVATVDGQLLIDSPAGGPTTVTVDIPLRTGAHS